MQGHSTNSTSSRAGRMAVDRVQCTPKVRQELERLTIERAKLREPWDFVSR
jgi:hypothetical protein